MRLDGLPYLYFLQTVKIPDMNNTLPFGLNSLQPLAHFDYLTANQTPTFFQGLGTSIAWILRQ